MVISSTDSYQHVVCCAASPWYVFVYGTLRQGGSNDINCLQPSPTWVGKATVKGVLYDLGPYPGLLLPASLDAMAHGVIAREVVGEIYAVPLGLLRQLDALEQITPDLTDEYRRRWILLDPPALGHSLACLVYEISPERVLEKSCISSGDWFERA